MDTKQIPTWGAWALAFVLVWFSISAIDEITETATSRQIAPDGTNGGNGNGTGFGDLSLADSALEAKATIQFHEFGGKHTTPFRDDGKPPPRVRRNVRAKRERERPVLKIKGILEKDNPLAVIEDASGKTYICETGDTVLQQRIVRINTKEVVLNDKYGTYDLQAPAN